MTPEQWKEVGRIFDAAAAMEPEERPRFLDRACGQDEALRREVQSLLELDGQARGFLGGGAMEDVARVLAGQNAPSLPGQKLGQYELLSLIGAGGMGQVYRAHDEALKRDVAVKVLLSTFSEDVERLQRFKQEARAASALSHPNIVTIHAIGELDSCHFIVSEYVEGETLRERLNRGRLDINEVLDVATQIATGLAAAHKAGVIHRDIKPENIMLRPDGYVKILDFGLAKLTERPAGDLSLDARLKTKEGVVMGTIPYMSPEQARGLEMDPRTDVWSLGVVIYEMLAGRAPFEGQTNSDVIASILEREPASLSSFASDVPPKLQRIVAQALRKDREERYQTVKDMLLDLKSLRTPLAESLSQKIKRHKLALALALTFATLALGVAYVAHLLYQRRSANQQQPELSLTRVTFDAGLQSEPTWSPDGRFIAYSSDKGANLDIWVQLVGGSNAVQVTHSPASDWQPDWSPDGSQIVFRSERDGGGLYTVPVLGGHEQKISSFGYRPRWSPDGLQILFTDMWIGAGHVNVGAKLYVTRLGGEPQEILAGYVSRLRGMDSFAWHPDGQRITIVGNSGFWTVPLQGGTPVNTEITGDVCAAGEFRWAPAGDVLYFQGLTKEIRNLWMVAVDPHSLRLRGRLERLTTGNEPDTDIALSPEGTRVAFAKRTEEVRVWSLPFDARDGKLAGAGQPVTAAGIMPSMLDMTRDGKKLVFIGLRTGTQKKELWEKSLEDGRERLLTVREYLFFNPRWSHDGTRVTYQLPTWVVSDRPRVDPATVILPVNGGDEQKLTSGKGGEFVPFDWSADGQWVLATKWGDHPGRGALVLLPLSAAPHAEAEARVVVSDSERPLFEGRFSPDGRWLCFQAWGRGASTIYVVPSSGGGEWVRITDENGLADKPRWSPDGRTIYFVSRRGMGFLNVWGIRFDQVKGEPVGEPFQVTFYEGPAKGIWTDIGSMQMALSAHRLVLPVTEVTGNIWVLEGVNR